MEMNENKALEIIEQMISNAKREIKDNGKYHMMWGYLVFVSALIDYFLLITGKQYHAYVWGILMPLGGLVSILMGRKQSKNQRVVTYVDEVFKYVIIAFVVSLLLVCLIMPMTSKHWSSFYPVLMIIYAFALFIMGGILQFRPLRMGAMAIWTCSFVAFFVGYDYQLLLLALAVLSGFIIPGHLLNLRARQHV
ncbi:MAG: hypothetical protein SGJ00_13725 [bacterium]|nr:hypothetical protein [bacterium]